MTCAHCTEPVAPEERADVKGADLHEECFFRTIAGSVWCVMGWCKSPALCAGDPPGMTPRQAAKASLLMFRQLESVRAAASVFYGGRRGDMEFLGDAVRSHTPMKTVQ